MNNTLAIAAVSTFTALAGAAAGLGAQAADAAPAHASHPPVRVIADCVHARHEPSQIVIACGDDGIFFKHLHYTSWTATKATGEGQLWVNTDDPNAAAGNYVHETVRVTLDKPEHVDGQLRYSRIVTHYTDKHGKKRTQSFFPPVRKA